MAHLLRYEFRLFGALKGATKNINGHQFVDGICAFGVDPAASLFVQKHLSTYGAFAKGTPEYDAALAKENEENGVSSDVHPSSEQGQAEAVPSGVRETGRQVTKATSDFWRGAADGEAGDSRVRSEGDGHEDTGLPKFEVEKDRPQPEEPSIEKNREILVALQKLDPNEDSHWTTTGKPMLKVVEDVYGRAGITRQDVESAAPGYNRDKALEALMAI